MFRRATSPTAARGLANWAILRALGGVPAIKGTKIYPLAQADRPDENVFLNIAELAFNTIHANNLSFYEELDELVQEEPVEALDAERAGQLAAIGIVRAGRSRPMTGCARFLRTPSASAYASPLQSTSNTSAPADQPAAPPIIGPRSSWPEKSTLEAL